MDKVVKTSETKLTTKCAWNVPTEIFPYEHFAIIEGIAQVCLNWRNFKQGLES